MAKIKTRRYYLYYLARISLFLMSFIPLKVSLFMADLIGRAAFRLVRKYRDIAIRNLDMVFEGSHEENVKIAERVFSNLAKNGAEWIKLYAMDTVKFGKVVNEAEGMERLDAVLSEGRGAVVMGFHFGNWELLGLYLKHKGYDGALVGRRIYFHKYDKLLTRMRMRYGARTIYRDESPKKMLRELREGKILGIVPDQDVDSVDGVFVNFFGRPAYTPKAPVKIAMAAKTKILPVFLIRKKDDTHKLVVEEPIDPSLGGTDEEAIKRYTQQWTNALERYVRKYPEQWVWIHKRWKTAPKEAGDRIAQSA
jgi:KDO2-lipid IV(A) lauroyltransferase